MSKRNFREINIKIQEMLTNGESLNDFYRFTSLNPHIPLHDACQIVVERPDANVCYSFDKWNSMGYRILRGSKGIRFYDLQGDKSYLLMTVVTLDSLR